MENQFDFGSVCSGIEAASVAWHPLGWKTAWVAEIETFPSQVLKHHYPDTPNLGDMTKIAAAYRAGKKMKQAADGPRYKAIGNSMCVNNMRFIGERIQMFIGEK